MTHSPSAVGPVETGTAARDRPSSDPDRQTIRARRRARRNRQSVEVARLPPLVRAIRADLALVLDHRLDHRLPAIATITRSWVGVARSQRSPTVTSSPARTSPLPGAVTSRTRITRLPKVSHSSVETG